jgi:leucyl aminopeptidase (aminopeptidase T)
MRIDIGTETRDGYMSFELARTARKLVEQVFPIHPGEDVAITADTASDSRVVNATADAIFALGAHPVVIWYESLPEAAGSPPAPVAAALKAAQAWIEFAPPYLLHGPAHREALKAGCRFLCATALDVDGMIRMIGQQDHLVLADLENKLRSLSQAGKTVRITTPEGTNLVVQVAPPASEPAKPSTGGKGFTQFPPGASGFAHKLDTVEGTLVFDGAIFPPKGIGVLEAPVIMEVSGGYVKSVTGGPQAKLYKRWLTGWNNPLMFQIAHFSYGCNPGIRRCSGRSAEDARVFGSLDIGLGITAQGAPTHSDGVVLNPTLWVDQVQLQEEGEYVHPELVAICRKLGVAGY